MKQRSREESQPYVIEKRVVVAGEDLIDAQPGFDQRTSEPIVSFRFNTNGARENSRKRRRRMSAGPSPSCSTTRLSRHR